MIAASNQLTFSIPWKSLCSDNRKYLSRKFILSPQYRQAKAVIGLIAKSAASQQAWRRASEPLELIVLITEPDNRYRDLNFSKNLKDGISAAERVWVDDCQVRREVWEFLPHPDKSHPGAVVTIRPYQPQPIAAQASHD